MRAIHLILPKIQKCFTSSLVPAKAQECFLPCPQSMRQFLPLQHSSLRARFCRRLFSPPQLPCPYFARLLLLLVLGLATASLASLHLSLPRSEERRVGKECRS